MSCSRFPAEWERGELKDGLAGSGCQQDGLYMLMVRNPGHELTITGEEGLYSFLAILCNRKVFLSSHRLQIVHTFMHDA